MISGLLSKIGLGKFQLIAGGVLLTLLLSSGLYTKHLIGANATLQNDLDRRESQIASLKDDIVSQEERYKASLKILSDREENLITLKKEQKEDKKILKRLKSENEEIRAYFDKRIPDTIYNLLLPSKKKD